MMSSELRCFQVDAFSSRPFQGNPAAVVFCDSPLETSVCQKIAAEFALSETAFITPDTHITGERMGCGDEDPKFTGSSFGLRWFTPTVEVALCGHATLASAHVLFNEAMNSSETLTFNTKSGPLSVKRGKDGGTNMAMQFPLNDYSVLARERHREMAPLLRHVLCFQGVSQQRCHLSMAAVLPHLYQVCYSPTTRKLVVRLHDGQHELLRRIAPRTADLHAVDQTGLRFLREVIDRPAASSDSAAGLPPVTGISVTVRAPADAPGPSSGERENFWSRYFSPWNGIPEDPVNGSSHTILAPFWAEQLGLYRIDSEAARSESTPLGHVRLTATLSAVQQSARTGRLGLQTHELRPLSGCAAVGCTACADAVSKGDANALVWAHVGRPIPGASTVSLLGEACVVYRGALSLPPAPETQAPSTSVPATNEAGRHGPVLPGGEWWSTAPASEVWRAAREAWPPSFWPLFEPGDSEADLDAAESRLGVKLPQRVRELMRECAGAGIPSPSLLSLLFPPEVCLVPCSLWVAPPALLGEELQWDAAALADRIVIGFNPEGSDYSQPVLLRLSDCHVLGVTENIPEAKDLGTFDSWIARNRVPGCAAPAGGVYLDEPEDTPASVGESHSFYLRCGAPAGMDNSRRAREWSESGGKQDAFVAALAACLATS